MIPTEGLLRSALPFAQQIASARLRLMQQSWLFSSLLISKRENDHLDKKLSNNNNLSGLFELFMPELFSSLLINERKLDSSAVSLFDERACLEKITVRTKKLRNGKNPPWTKN